MSNTLMFFMVKCHHPVLMLMQDNFSIDMDPIQAIKETREVSSDGISTASCQLTGTISMTTWVIIASSSMEKLFRMVLTIQDDNVLGMKETLLTTIVA